MFQTSEPQLDFQDVLIVPKYSYVDSRAKVDLKQNFEKRKLLKGWREIVPIIASNMDATGTFQTARVMAMYQALTAIHKYYSMEEWESFLDTSENEVLNHLILTTGTSANEQRRVQKLIEKTGIRKVCIDVANGYTHHFFTTVEEFKNDHYDVALIAGNVCTYDGAKKIFSAGADIVKVGVGPGSVCTTRRVTGVGYPQFSAICNCVKAAEESDGLIISDGGCRYPGDIAKAFGAGANFVMLGGMLAGHQESSGEIVSINDKEYKQFYGMASFDALSKYSGGCEKYRTAEGKSVLVPYRGSLESTIETILAGLRSTCTYVNCPSLYKLPSQAKFIRVNHQLNECFLEN
ncbi:GMP reductase-like [Hylaeus volcanicus]|uniref:GMP reductase-like n=1 Tax=Hylaeus volcanicus TaxID=313075 RepID=UPI0023B84D67|nr:GMP reductase-like [Hylaeus volcanicus]